MSLDRVTALATLADFAIVSEVEVTLDLTVAELDSLDFIEWVSYLADECGVDLDDDFFDLVEIEQLTVSAVLDWFLSDVSASAGKPSRNDQASLLSESSSVIGSAT